VIFKNTATEAPGRQFSSGTAFGIPQKQGAPERTGIAGSKVSILPLFQGIVCFRGLFHGRGHHFHSSRK